MVISGSSLGGLGNRLDPGASRPALRSTSTDTHRAGWLRQAPEPQARAAAWHPQQAVQKWLLARFPDKVKKVDSKKWCPLQVSRCAHHRIFH